MSAQLRFSEFDHVLYNINAFDLLGLKGLSPEEQSELTVRFARASLRAGIEKYLFDHNVSEHTLDNLENKFNGQISSLEAQEYLVKTFPGITDTIKWTTVDLKKKALMKQIEDLLNTGAFDKSGLSLQQSELVCSDLIKSLRVGDLSLFEKSFKEYKALKEKL